MKIVKFENLKDLIKVISVVDDEKEWKKLLDQARSALATNLKIKGFRKGKVPSSLVDQYVKSADILDFAADLGQKKAAQDVIKQHQSVLVGKYRLLKNKVEKISFSEFQICQEWQKLPSVEIKKWKDFSCVLEVIAVSEQEIKSKIEELRHYFATFEEKEGKVQLQDFVLLNYQGKIDGKSIPSLTAKEFNYQIGSKKFGDQFEQQILGTQKEEQKNFVIHLAKDYFDSQLANKKVVFDVQIVKVQNQKLPDPQTELVAQLKMEQIKSYQDLQYLITESIKKQKQNQLHQKIIDLVWPQLLKNAEFDIPHTYLEQEIKVMRSRYIEDLESKKLSLVQHLKERKISELQFDQEVKEKVVKVLHDYLVVTKLASAEKIEVGKKEIEDYYHFLSKNQKKSLEEVKKTYSEILLFNNLLRFKVEEFLVKNTLHFNKLDSSSK